MSSESLNLEERHLRGSTKASVLCALLGLLLAAALTAGVFALFGVGFHQLIAIEGFRGPIMAGVAGLMGSALLLGRVAGRFIYRFRLTGYGIPMVGIALASVCLFVSVVSGLLFSFYSHLHESEAFYNYLIRPLIGVIAVGAGPAIILGLVYSVLLRDELREDDYSA